MSDYQKLYKSSILVKSISEEKCIEGGSLLLHESAIVSISLSNVMHQTSSFILPLSFQGGLGSSVSNGKFKKGCQWKYVKRIKSFRCVENQQIS